VAKPKLTLAELKALKSGDKVHVRYKEDGKSRLNGVFSVLENTDEMLIVQDEMGPEEFPWDTWDDECEEFNEDDGIGVIRKAT
jgi:hypothetical protein